jgi:hypothetical protein
MGAIREAIDVKLCPFCAEEIQDAAIKCKHCGSMLAEFGKPPALPRNLPIPSKDAIPWYFKRGALIAGGFILGPLMPVMLPLLWFNPHINKRNKLIWTLVMLVLSAVFIWMTIWSIDTLLRFYRLMGV